MSYSITGTTDNCYEGTTCLINKLGITDETKLFDIEANITFVRSVQLEEKPIEGNFDTNHYKAIHYHLFQDLYDWAGQFRNINFSKQGTSFADKNEIETLCNNCFSRLKDCNYFTDMNFDEFVENLVDLYCTLNIIHPFREGNGRTQRIFISQLIRFNGYDINFSDIDSNLVMIATIKSAQGITDTLFIYSKTVLQKFSQTATSKRCCCFFGECLTRSSCRQRNISKTSVPERNLTDFSKVKI